MLTASDFQEDSEDGRSPRYDECGCSQMQLEARNVVSLDVDIILPDLSSFKACCTTAVAAVGC